MPATIEVIEIRGLGKRKMSELAEQAKEMGVSPADYVKRLVEDKLAMVREARMKTFAQIMGSGGDIDESELDRLVEKSKTRFHQSLKR